MMFELYDTISEKSVAHLEMTSSEVELRNATSQKKPPGAG